MTIPLDLPIMFERAEGLNTRALEESGVEKFNDTTGATDASGIWSNHRGRRDLTKHHG